MSEQDHEQVSGGELVARILEQFGVPIVFGVISIHNVPILDAIERRGFIHYVAARGEAGATNMADGFARASKSLGVVVTSTGPGAGNAAGAMTEALSAGTPLLHLTGQIDAPDVDHLRGMNHETADQLGMLRAVSKAAFRVRSSGELARVVTQAITTALTAPTGPVSVEIPIDIQTRMVRMPSHVPSNGAARGGIDREGVDRLVAMLAASRRPLLWTGGGARHAGKAVARLLDRGVALVTSIHGRAVVPEDHPMSLGALNNGGAAERFYAGCDLLMAAGTRLRGNETRVHRLKLPTPMAQIDVDLAAWNRNYATDLFVLGDSDAVLDAVVERLPADWRPDAGFADDLAGARREAQREIRDAIGPYAELSDLLRAAMPRDAFFVRDVTLSANTWANRLFPMYHHLGSIHALGGGIGQGLQQAIGASYAAAGRKVVALCGDGGLAVNIGELMTAVQEEIDLLVIVMNDGGYGVIRNITEAAYGQGRVFYSDLFLPDLQDYARVLGMASWRVASLDAFAEVIPQAVAASGPRLLEVDMAGIGAFPLPFAGPKR
jgi:acetolactate synthase I/II/III large subunit